MTSTILSFNIPETKHITKNFTDITITSKVLMNKPKIYTYPFKLLLSTLLCTDHALINSALH